jgi:addiction module HigA family antidote
VLIWKIIIEGVKAMLKNNLPPVHPGVYIKESLPEAGINQAALADILGCSKSYVSDIIHGRRGLSVEMCFKLAQVLGGSPEFWGSLQNGYDMKMARKDGAILSAIKRVQGELRIFRAQKQEERHA